MKKIIPFCLLALFGLISFNCTSDDDDQVYVDYDTYPVAYDLNNVSFELVNNSFQIARTFTDPMFETDMLLIYMKVGNTNNNAPIWQQIPYTMYLSDGNEVDYNFDFSRFDFVIYAGGTFNLTPEFTQNKTFRVLIIPASYGKATDVNYSDYNSVVNYYKIDDSNPVSL